MQILGLESLLGSEELWPVLLGITVIPTVLQMALLPFCPESPRFLYIVRCQEHHAKSGEVTWRINHIVLKASLHGFRIHVLKKRIMLTLYQKKLQNMAITIDFKTITRLDAYFRFINIFLIKKKNSQIVYE